MGNAFPKSWPTLTQFLGSKLSVHSDFQGLQFPSPMAVRGCCVKKPWAAYPRCVWWKWSIGERLMLIRNFKPIDWWLFVWLCHSTYVTTNARLMYSGDSTPCSFWCGDSRNQEVHDFDSPWFVGRVLLATDKLQLDDQVKGRTSGLGRKSILVFKSNLLKLKVQSVYSCICLTVLCVLFRSVFQSIALQFGHPTSSFRTISLNFSTTVTSRRLVSLMSVFLKEMDHGPLPMVQWA